MFARRFVWAFKGVFVGTSMSVSVNIVASTSCWTLTFCCSYATTCSPTCKQVNEEVCLIVHHSMLLGQLGGTWSNFVQTSAIRTLKIFWCLTIISNTVSCSYVNCVIVFIMLISHMTFSFSLLMTVCFFLPLPWLAHGSLAGWLQCGHSRETICLGPLEE